MFVDLFGVGPQEQCQDGIANHEQRQARQGSREERQAGQFLRDADGERIEDCHREAHIGGQDGHAQADHGVPAEREGQGNDDRHERDNFLEDAEERPQRHEEKDDHQEHGILAPAEGFDDARDDRF